MPLVIAPVVFALIDVGITLWYQPAGYWSRQPGAVNEAQPAANWLMTFHPGVALAFHFLWIASFCFLILVLPRRLAIFIAAVVTIGHVVGVHSWLPNRIPYAYQAGNVFAIVAASLLAVTLPLPPITADNEVPAPRGIRLWAMRGLIALLIAIPVYVCVIQRGGVPVEVGNVAKKTNEPPVYRFGRRAGVDGGSQGISWPESVPGIGGTTVQYGLWEDGPAFIIWADSRVGWLGGSPTSHRTPEWSRGTYVYEAPVKLRADIFENVSGRISTFEINDSLYDLNKGGLFLLAQQTSGAQVVQLKVDVSKLSPEQKALEKFAEAHPEIAAFFAKSRAGKR